MGKATFIDFGSGVLGNNGDIAVEGALGHVRAAVEDGLLQRKLVSFKELDSATGEPYENGEFLANPYAIQTVYESDLT